MRFYKVERFPFGDHRSNYICIYLHNHVKDPNIQVHKFKCSRTTKAYMIFLRTAFGSVQEHFSLPETQGILFLLSMCFSFINFPFFFLLPSVIYAINLYIIHFNWKFRQGKIHESQERIVIQLIPPSGVGGNNRRKINVHYYLPNVLDVSPTHSHQTHCDILLILQEETLKSQYSS